MNEKDALLLACPWRSPLPNRDLTARSQAQRADPGADTHIMQVGERGRLPRGRLLRTERIPKERHLRPDEERSMLPVRTSRGYRRLGQ